MILEHHVQIKHNEIIRLAQGALSRFTLKMLKLNSTKQEVKTLTRNSKLWLRRENYAKWKTEAVMSTDQGIATKTKQLGEEMVEALSMSMTDSERDAYLQMSQGVPSSGALVKLILLAMHEQMQPHEAKSSKAIRRSMKKLLLNNDRKHKLEIGRAHV